MSRGSTEGRIVPAHMADPAPDVVRLFAMKITLELDEEQSWVLVSALGRAWADAMREQKYQVAQEILNLQKLVNEQQQAGYSLLRTSAK